ncbi:permease prefix domain 1-containing protein [Catenuloplanes japonicus]|uniref:permease prefix domain 1-containing protein n=1 Tax=Catenuloplanes japonicus TaxID=33876 RepID=UPI000525B9F9|nr:permease prefix domain 1-containing protein [Catenuloplanes japonicus]
MTVTDGKDEVEDQFVQWREYVRRRPELRESDADELEDHLRETVDGLVALGLSRDEAFLVAVKRMGGLDDLSREFAREHSERLWKQLMFTGEPADPARRGSLYAMLVCALGAAVSIKVPELFGLSFADGAMFYPRNFGLFTLPWLAAFLVWRRRPATWVYGVLAAMFALGAVVANAYPLGDDSQSIGLVMSHLPLALWLLVGLAYVSDDLRASRRRMDFIRFTGEWFVYLVLMMLGGGVLIAFLYGIFDAIGVSADDLIENWVVPCGLVAATVVGGWLVEVKQGVIENIAPVLTRLFTPLFTVALLAYLAVIGWNGSGIDVDRDALVMFDLLLAVVLGLLLYSLSARDPQAPRGPFDVMQLALVVAALLIDALVLYTMAGRIAEYGTTPNNTTAIGQNIVLLVNLTWSAWLLFGFVRRRAGFAAIERWQTLYLPVYAVWFWTVVLVLPPVFGFR